MKKIIMICSLLGIMAGCVLQKRQKITEPDHSNIRCWDVADSIKSMVAQRNGDYIYYKSYGSVYIIFNEYKTRIYKVNSHGIYLYHKSYYFNGSFSNLENTYETILNDSVYPTEADRGIFISHAEHFILECKLNNLTIIRGGPYYLLRKDQPLYLLLSKIERELFRATEDWGNWTKVSGISFCIE